jgi:hypothetical protein
MIAVITFIHLKSPFKFFSLSYNAMHIVLQLRKTNYLKYKSTGFWTKHYTLSLWDNVQDMKNFARSGAHLEAMKKSAKIAKEIRTAVVHVEAVPTWQEAKAKVQAEGRIVNFQ